MKKTTFIFLVLIFSALTSVHASTITATNSGKWSQGSTWSTGSSPGTNDDVVINSGVVVKLTDDYTCGSLILNGTLQFNQNEKGNLIVTGNVTVNSGGGINTLLSGADKQQSLTIGGNLINNGSIDLSNSSSLLVQLTFNGNSNATWTMNSGSVTDVALDSGVVVNKGSSVSTTLTTNFNGTFTVDGGTGASFMRLINGLCTIGGNQAISNSLFSPTYYEIPSTAGLRLNTSSFTITGQTGTLTNSGLLRVSAGTCTIGSASGSLLTGNGQVLIDGGTLSIGSQYSSSAGNFTLTSGTVNINTVANAVASAPSFTLGASSSFTFSGGTINLVQANSNGTTPLDYQNDAGTLSISGGTFNIGTSATATNFSFRISGALPSLVVDNTTNNKTAILSAAATSYSTVLVNTGAGINTNGYTLSARGASFTNNGTLSGNGAVSFDASTAQTFSGSGSVATNITITNSTGLGLSTGIAFGNNNTLTVAAGAQLDAKTYTFSFGTGGAVVINGLLYTQNTNGVSGGASTSFVSTNTPTITLSSSSIVYYNAASTQTVTGRAYGNLTILLTAAKILNGAASIGNGNTLTVSSGTTFDAANNVISFGATATAQIDGTFRNSNANGFSGSVSTSIASTNSPTVNLGSSSTVQYNGTGSQAVTARTDYANLTISGSRAGGTVTLAAGTIGITGAFTVSATSVSYAVTGNTCNYKGNSQAVAAINYNNLDLTGATGTTFPTGTAGVAGTFTPASITTASQGTINFRGASQAIPVFNYYNLDLTSATGTTFPSGTITITATFTPASITAATQGTINYKGSTQIISVFNYNNLDLTTATGSTFPSGTVGIAGTFTPASITTATQGTINFRGATQSIPVFNYYSLDLTTATGTGFPSGTIAISGAFTPASIIGATSGTINFKGSGQTVPVFNYNNLSLTTATGTVFANGTVGIAGTFTPASISSASQGTISFNANGSQTIPVFGYYNLYTATAGPKTFAGATTIANTFTVTCSTTLNNFNVTVNGTFNHLIGTLTLGSGTFEVKGDFMRTGGIYAYGTSTTVLSGTSAQTIFVSAADGLNFYALTLTGAGAKQFTAGQNGTISNNFSVAAATPVALSAATATVFTISSGLDYNATTGGSNLGSLTLLLTSVNGTLGGSISVVTPNITIASTARRTLVSNFAVSTGRTLTIDGSLIAGTNVVSGAGNMTIASTGKVWIANNSGLSGTVAISGTKSFNAGAQYYYNGSSAQSTGFAGITLGSPASINITNTAAVVSLDADVTLAAAGLFAISANANFDAGTKKLAFGLGGSVTVDGTFSTANVDGFSGGATTAITSANSPAIALASGSTIAYTASSPQVISARTDYGNLTASNGTKNPAGAVTLAGNLVLAGGSKIVLGANQIDIAGTATGDASNFVVTDGAGSVVLRSVTNTGKQFPIGASTSSYSPVTIAQASSLAWTVRVGSTITPVALNPGDAIQRTWVITPSTNPTPSGATLTFQYNEADASIQGATWSTSGAVALSRHNGSSWSTMVTGLTASGTPGGIRTVTAGGFMQFSPWVVSRSSSPLPVQLLSFSGLRSGSDNKLQWRTATESDNAGFDIERSDDGQRFTRLLRVPSRAPGGNSSSVLAYTYTDVNAAAQTHYYRLRQQDINGRFTYSQVIQVSGNSSGLLVEGLFPNPATEIVQARVHMSVEGKVQLYLFDAQGRMVQGFEKTLGAGSNTINLPLATLPAGVYWLRIQAGNESPVQERLVKN
jgi:hypothetical protein